MKKKKILCSQLHLKWRGPVVVAFVDLSASIANVVHLPVFIIQVIQ